LRRRRFAVGERERLRVLVFGLVFASRAAPTLVRGRRGGIVSFASALVVPRVRRATTAWDDRRGSLSRPATERQPLRTLVAVVCRAL